MLTGSAAGLAVVAGATLGRGQPAEAQTLVASVVDWINITNNPSLSKAGQGRRDDRRYTGGQFAHGDKVSVFESSQL
jgi:hypothetical protein